MKRKQKDIIIIGAALFAMFFGAGNLIFPPAIGFTAGNHWFITMVGFLLTGVGLPILGIIAVSYAGGSINDLASKVSPLFSKILGTVIILAIGPLLAIPRTGATVFEIGIRPIFSNANPLLVSIVYFSITLFFVIKPSGIVDKIGKILTPILLIVISTIIIKGIVNPIGTPTSSTIMNPFSKGFLEGYQTMDALASIVFGGIVLISLIEKGYNDKKTQVNITTKAGILAGIGLAFVYGGLLYLGSTSSNMFETSITKTKLIVSITNSILGNSGQIGLCLAVSAACLTTSIGLTATVGNYFENLSRKKLSYKFIVIITVIFSTVMSVVGVEKIVAFSVPLLTLVYPIAIILILFNLIDKWLPSKQMYRGAVIGALAESIFSVLLSFNIQIPYINNFISCLPFAKTGFGWIVPSITLSLIAGLIPMKIESDSINYKQISNKA